MGKGVVAVRTEQLEFDLRDLQVRVPWNGQSPRGLTRVGLSPIFKAQAAKGRPTIHVGQLDLFGLRVEGPFVYEGAPLLREPHEGR